jgi:hypothetical protein
MFHSLPSFNETQNHQSIPQFNANTSISMFPMKEQELPTLAETGFNQPEINNNEDFAVRFNSSHSGKSYGSQIVNENEKKNLSVYVPSSNPDFNYPGLDSVQKHSNNQFKFDVENPTTKTFNFEEKAEFEFPQVSNLDPFKVFAEKKGDDMFKDGGFGNDADWDFH